MAGFIDFIRKQGVVGLAIGFILGGTVSKVVLGLVLGKVGDLSKAYVAVGTAKIMCGNFVSVLIGAEVARARVTVRGSPSQ